jgi:hypothetical protein
MKAALYDWLGAKAWLFRAIHALRGEGSIA